MMKQTRCYGCDKPIEPEWLPVGEFIVCDECSSDTDELSVEKIQEIRVEELKDFNSKILQAELKNQKLQEQLNTAKKALTEIASTRQGIWRGGTFVGYEATEDAQIAINALAEIGNEGSGDE